MIGVEVGIISVFIILFLIYTGVHVAVALGLVSFIGVWVYRGSFDIAVSLLAAATHDTIAHTVFANIPLFALMGIVASEIGLGGDVYKVADQIFRRVRGGLGMATVAANALFASITGSSIASAAVFTKIATPEMLRHGYTPRFSVGVVAGSSVLGMLIPPSLLLIIYGFLAEESVGQLFLAAIVPGIILAAAMSLGIVLMAVYMPSLIGGNEIQDDDEDIRSAAIKLLPIVLLIALVMGGIYGGVFTPTEAGAAGAMMVPAVESRSMFSIWMWLKGVSRGTSISGRRSLSITAPARVSRLSFTPAASLPSVSIEQGMMTIARARNEPEAIEAATSELPCTTSASASMSAQSPSHSCWCTSRAESVATKWVSTGCSFSASSNRTP